MRGSDIKKIAAFRWIQRWAGSYTFLSCSYWGKQYYHSLEKHLGVHFDHTLFIHRKGTVAFFIVENEFRHLGKILAKKSEKGSSFAKKYCDALKKNTDILLPLMEKLQRKIPTLPEYKKFNSVFDRHLAFHVFVKKTTDFLSVEGLEKLLLIFKDARLYSEKVYSESERFFRNVMKFISKKEGYSADYLTCLTQEEFEKYLKSGTLPDETALKRRYGASILYFEDNKMSIALGRVVVDKIEKVIVKQAMANKSEINGIAVYPGRITGKARIILDPFHVKIFNENDILVTGMTRPEFMSLIKKSSAIVTDVGGVLSHAAIVARELKKPCVIGTKIATKVLKDGERVEVDAIKGIVRKLQSN